MPLLLNYLILCALMFSLVVTLYLGLKIVKLI